MPAISSLMSASSSTTRMSDAMGPPLFLLGLGRVLACTRWRGRARLGHSLIRARPFPLAYRKIDPHRRPLDLAVAFRRIGERQRPAMLLGNSLGDREAQPRPLVARGHVGFDQPLAILLGQTAAIVDDGNLHPLSLGADLGHDAAPARAGGIGLKRP